MTNHKMHCESCKKRYGYDFSEIHTWMDEPVSLNGSAHRKHRHDDEETPRLAVEIFSDKVPNQYRIFIRDAVLDHLILDAIETRVKKNYDSHLLVPPAKEPPLVNPEVPVLNYEKRVRFVPQKPFKMPEPEKKWTKEELDKELENLKKKELELRIKREEFELLSETSQ
jgi:hypothetical protein